MLKVQTIGAAVFAAVFMICAVLVALGKAPPSLLETLAALAAPSPFLRTGTSSPPPPPALPIVTPPGQQ